MVTFLLPLAWLRFFWWRFNVWGELAAVTLGLPIAIIVWFGLGLKDQDAVMQGLGILGLLVLSIIVLITVSLLTPAESQETLERFYRRCKPPGLWGKVLKNSTNNSLTDSSDKGLLTKSLYGIGACTFLCIATNLCFLGSWLWVVISLFVALSLGYLLLRQINMDRP